jgi:hypothetical protein
VLPKVELAKLLQQHYAVREAEAATRKGVATMGELSAVYLHGVDLDTDLKPATKQYRHKTVKYLLRSWPELAERIPAKVSEAECKQWAAQYHAAFSQCSVLASPVAGLNAAFLARLDRIQGNEEISDL